MDMADRNGDMFFDMRSKALALECQPPINPHSAHDCSNPEVVGNDLVITKLQLDVQLPLGNYGRCNICDTKNATTGTCSDSHGDENCTCGAYVCNCNPYGGGKAACGPAVGYENVTAHFASRGCGRGSTNWECWHDNIAKKTGGNWYSAFKNGYGTQWKVSQIIKRVNKTCSDNVINTAVEKAGPAIFKKFGAKTGAARNTSSPQYVTAWYTTVLGAAAGTPGGAAGPAIGMNLATLEASWDAPFASEDPAKGGCPDLPVDDNE